MKYELAIMPYIDHQQAVRDHHDACALVHSHLAWGLAEALQIPEPDRRDLIRHVPLSQPRRWDEFLHASQAVELESDGVATAGIVVILSADVLNIRTPLLIPLEYRKVGTSFKARTTNDSVKMAFAFHPPPQPELLQFGELLSERIGNSYRGVFEKWRDGNGSLDRIGFR